MVTDRRPFMTFGRWIAVIPAGVVAAMLVTFPIHWSLSLVEGYGTFVFAWLGSENIETLIIAFSSPYVFIRAGAYTSPGFHPEAGVALSIIVALALGGIYVLAFTSSSLGGWYSLYYGATPVLNLVGIAAALYAVRDSNGLD